MAGPEHYIEAERLAGQAERLFEEFVAAHDEDGDTPGVHLIRRQAEHCREMGVLRATLALAAATALLGPHAANIENFDTFDAWREVAGSQPAPQGSGESRG